MATFCVSLLPHSRIVQRNQRDIWLKATEPPFLRQKSSYALDIVPYLIFFVLDLFLTRNEMTEADRHSAIAANRRDLMQIVAGLVAMLPEAMVGMLPRWLYLAILQGLRPAESALRRLIAMAAVGITVTPRKARAAPTGAIPSGSGPRKTAFGLFDPRKNVDPQEKHARGFGPNIRFFDGEDTAPPEKKTISPNDEINAQALCRRLAALQAAMDDIPGQARRLARILARGRARWKRVMRPGRPPGYRHRGKRPVDVLLADCQELALRALHDWEPAIADTS